MVPCLTKHRNAKYCPESQFYIIKTQDNIDNNNILLFGAITVLHLKLCIVNVF